MERFLLLVLLAGCGDDREAPIDAGFDAGLDAGFDAAPDADAGRREDAAVPDAGLPATGCELLADGGEPQDAGEPDAAPIPPPDGYPPLAGPGGPSRSFTAAELLEPCAFLDGGPPDHDHHNTVVMLDGYLFLPWAHEAGPGGISVYEIDDPCAPELVATVTDEAMRETHAAGIAHLGGRRIMAVTSLTGIQLWDVTDPRDMQQLVDFTLPGVVYPDSYARVVMSISWQAPYLYAGASDNGVFVVDASDPAAPVLLAQHVPDPPLRVGGVHAAGNLLVLLPSEGSRTQLLDISDPDAPRFIPGGTWLLHDGTLDRFGRPALRSAYFGHFNGGRTYYARHLIGGGLIVFDVNDPTTPTFVGNYQAEGLGASGGYVYFHHDHAFVGLSTFGQILDISDPTAPVLEGTIQMVGDNDTVIPVGNVVVSSVDDDGEADRGSGVFPWAAEPDGRAPVVNFVSPRDGQTAVAISARIGITLDELIEMGTVFEGSFQLRAMGSDRLVPGTYSGQEGLVSFSPAGPLRPETTYEVIVPAGGIRDVSGNAIETAFRSTFTTVRCD